MWICRYHTVYTTLESTGQPLLTILHRHYDGLPLAPVVVGVLAKFRPPPLQEVDGVVHLLQQVLRLRLEVLVVFAYAATLESVAIVDVLPGYNAAAGHGLCRHVGG